MDRTAQASHSTSHLSSPAQTAKSEQQTDGFIRAFKSHPASVGETYFGHLGFAMRFAFRLFAAGGAALVHAFIPAWFETTASRQIQKMHDEMMKRHAGGDNH